jgi:hypothetical protein
MHTSAYVRCWLCESVYIHIRQRMHTSAYVSIRQYTSAYVSIRHVGRASVYTCVNVCIRQHTSEPWLHALRARLYTHTSMYAYVSIRSKASITASSKARSWCTCRMLPQRRCSVWMKGMACGFVCAHTTAYVSIRQHTSAYVSKGMACGFVCAHTTAYVSIRQHTSFTPSFTSSFNVNYLISFRR